MALGDVIAAARRDSLSILSSGGFQTDITISKGAETITCTGLGLVHHLAVDTDGQAVNSKHGHITVHEDSLTGLTVRNAKNEVYLRNAIVEFADSTGIVKKYQVKENYADDTLGVIVLNLENYAD